MLHANFIGIDVIERTIPKTKHLWERKHIIIFLILLGFSPNKAKAQATLPAPVISAITQPTWGKPNGSVTLSNLPADTYWMITAEPAIDTVYGSGTETTIENIPHGDYQFTVHTEAPGTGLYAQFFDNKDLAGSPSLQRVDAQINYPRTENPVKPPSGYHKTTNYSIRWTGQIKVDETRNYTFRTWCDDGFRVIIHGSTILEDWSTHSAYNANASIHLEAHRKYDFEMEYFQGSGRAAAIFSWETSSGNFELVPTRVLYPNNKFIIAQSSVASDIVSINCVQALSPALEATNVEFSQNLEWAAVDGATNYRLFFGTNNPPSNIVNGDKIGNVLSYTPPRNHNSETTYYWRVVPVFPDETSPNCENIWSFTTKEIEYNNCNAHYSNGTQQFGDFIALVKLAEINNETAGTNVAPYYNDFTDQQATLTTGETYSITLQVGSYSSGNHIAAWIDFNRDGDFNDNNEKIGQYELSSNGSITDEFTVPEGAFIGNARLRVRETYNKPNMSPCATYTYGETEDYTVNIIEPCNITEAFTIDGSGEYCEFTEGASIGLNNSDPHITYVLLLNDTETEVKETGNGNTIWFTPQTEEGTYRIRAKDEINGCTLLMNGSIPVIMLPAPKTGEIVPD